MKRPDWWPKAHRLDDTVRVLCLEVADWIKARKPSNWCEYDLRKELVGCILGSQVRHEMASAATENLDRAGLLDDSWWSSGPSDGFATLVFEVLSGQRRDVPHKGAYRFAKTRTDQLTRIRRAFSALPLSARLGRREDARHLRRQLVADIPGAGPKQASMFLRNIGASYDLAILDTHVLQFMSIQGDPRVDVAQVRTLSGYERTEQALVRYANTIGFPVGYIDWAIWATMKAARELHL